MIKRYDVYVTCHEEFYGCVPQGEYNMNFYMVYHGTPEFITQRRCKVVNGRAELMAVTPQQYKAWYDYEWYAEEVAE